MACEIFIVRYNPFVRGVVSGFFDLQAAGILRLTVSTRSSDPGPYPDRTLRARLGNGAKVLYDMHDGYEFLLGTSDPWAQLDRTLETVDVYFKTTCIPAKHSALKHAAKIHPLGILASFMGSINNPYDLGLRPFSYRRIASNMVGLSRRLSILTEHTSRHMWPREYERPPDFHPARRAIYIARLWDPDDPDVLADDWREDRLRLNRFRAALIRLGQRELGPQFVGGLVPTAYAVKRYPDCVLYSPETENRLAYLQTMRESAVGIATSGLHGCAGGKLTEYMAASRAVVAERLQIAMPGDFGSPANYLAASTPEECAAEAYGLLRDPTRTLEMMHRNWEYYRRFLRPSALVLRTLVEATAHAAQVG